MSRDHAVECFQEMGVADEIVLRAVSAMKEAGVDPSLAVLSMLHFGIIKLSKEMHLYQEIPYLIFMEEYLADTRIALGMAPNEPFSEVERVPY